MTRAFGRSVLDEWVEPYARDVRPKGSPGAPFLAVREAAARLRYIPHGEREAELRRIAEEFGVSTRTIHRYLRNDVEIHEVAGWRAAFEVRPGEPPRRVTPWEPSAPR